eukprot:1194643-Prorocentrum_minimum.AAC.2
MTLALEEKVERRLRNEVKGGSLRKVGLEITAHGVILFQMEDRCAAAQKGVSRGVIVAWFSVQRCQVRVCQQVTHQVK